MHNRHLAFIPLKEETQRNITPKHIPKSLFKADYYSKFFITLCKLLVTCVFFAKVKPSSGRICLDLKKNRFRKPRFEIPPDLISHLSFSKVKKFLEQYILLYTIFGVCQTCLIFGISQTYLPWDHQGYL